MIRKIIKIDEEKCNGCGACVSACHEGALALKDGKAKLMREDYCDGLGNCLPTCPTGAISFEEREAAVFNEAAVKASLCQCPGSKAKLLEPSADTDTARIAAPGMLMQWPVQIKLVPVNAPYFDGADLLIAADCTAYAYGSFHNDFIRGRITLIGCPKLDDTDYSRKLAAIIASNNIAGITVTRMEVPCCGGIEHAVRSAVAISGKNIPLKIITISTQGNIIKET